MISTYSAYSNLLTIAKKNEYRSAVIIDAGHGGEDGGAAAADGTLEKDINLSIAMKLKSIFEQNGVKVITTRESDMALGDSTLKKLRQRKVSDMKERLSIFNSKGISAVISIHQNKFEKSQYNGTQVFYSPNNPLSKSLANEIRNSIINNLQPDNSRECKAANKSIYLLYNTQNPAVIVECGFLSNKEDLKKLKDSKYQDEIALEIFNGFVKFSGSQST